MVRDTRTRWHRRRCSTSPTSTGIWAVLSAGQLAGISSLPFNKNGEHSLQILTCDIPNLHSDIALPDFTQIKGNSWDNILNPLKQRGVKPHFKT